MALITSDFSSLPDVTISGARAPIVASKVFSYALFYITFPANHGDD